MLNIINIIASVLHFFFAREWTEAEATFYMRVRAYMLKSKPADSTRGLAVSNLRERQKVQKQNFFDISGDNVGAEWKKRYYCEFKSTFDT